jgi:hypothetical protein
MPWIIANKNGKFCVLKQSSGEVKHCYDKRRDALKYLRALYSNVPEARDEKDHAKRD